MVLLVILKKGMQTRQYRNNIGGRDIPITTDQTFMMTGKIIGFLLVFW